MENTILNEAIYYLTEEDEEVLKLRKLEKIEGIENIIAEQKLVIIFRAKNDDWTPNWNDSNQYKFYPWFYLGDNFRYRSYFAYCARSGVSSRLCVKSKEILIELMSEKEILDLYETYLS